MNTMSDVKSREVTAESTGPYMPSITRMNDPLIPGRIMAQIAIAPEPKNAHIAGSATCAAVSLDVLSRNPSSTNTASPTPAMIARRRTSRTVRSFHATTAEPATSPRKSAAINTA